MFVIASHVIKESEKEKYQTKYEQLSLFSTPEEIDNYKKVSKEEELKAKELQKTILKIKSKYILCEILSNLLQFRMFKLIRYNRKRNHH